MWIKRDFETFLQSLKGNQSLPVKVLKGPRQVGKTSIIEHAGSYQLIALDDHSLRQQAEDNPRLFLEQFSGPILLDEAPLAPALFPEIKRLVDQSRRDRRANRASAELDIWITGSNQTLLEKSVQESLAGRASYFDFNTLSIHELGALDLPSLMLRGGWPELAIDSKLDPVRYLNNLISTFIEKDIVAAAGIERKAAFTKTIGLIAGRIGQLFNASDIAANVGVESSTIHSWVAKLEQNAILRTVHPYYTNLNQRLIKSPKVYFEDVGLASRFQGWNEYQPLFTSPSFGHLIENLGLIEIVRFFINRGDTPPIQFLRSKEKVEVDFLVGLPNNRWLAVEVKSSPSNFSEDQLKLLEKTGLTFIDRWMIYPSTGLRDGLNCRWVSFLDIHKELSKLMESKR